MTNVIGIDPSLTATGIAYHDGTTVTCAGNDGDKRLIMLYGYITGAAEGASLAIVEDLPTHAHGAGKTGMAHGVVRLALMNQGVRYITVAPSTLKKFATGKGNATKPDMRMSLFQRAGLDIRDDNQNDAYWLRELGLHLIGEPTFDLPKTHRAALDAVRS